MSSKEAREVTIAASKAAGALNIASETISLVMEANTTLISELRLIDAEIRRSKEVVGLIRKEKCLQTSGVIAGIRMLQSHSEILTNDLDQLDGKDEDDLIKMLDTFRAKRKALAEQIRLASVGLTKEDGAITIQARLVDSTNQAVMKVLGKDSGLVIASFLAKLATKYNRVPDAIGEIQLSDEEYKRLSWKQIQTGNPEMKTATTAVMTRILCNCLARGQSIQILGPVAVDLWAGIAFIKIEGLVAMDQAIQFAYPVTWDVFKEGLNRQEKRIASTPVRKSRPNNER